MKTVNVAKRGLALACAAVIASLAFAGIAFAATVHGADFYETSSAMGSGEVDALNVDGKAGETIFIEVEDNGQTIAKNLPYTIGADAEENDQTTWAGVVTLNISDLDLQALNGSYKIKAYADRAGKVQLYDGALYGVYADIPNNSKLIGVRTVNAEEKDVRTFTPPQTIFDNGHTYRVNGTATGDGALHFAYEEYDEATTVNGIINYCDSEGNVVASTSIPGIAYNEEVTVKIPEVVVADNGDLYRTVFFKNSVKAKNPGALSFSIYCIKMSEADKTAAGFYVALIRMVDENGAVIATDSVNVTGKFVYTAPSNIYKKVTATSIGQPAVITYEIQESPTIYLNAATDGMQNRSRIIDVAYKAQSLDEPSVDVYFNLIDGSKPAGDKTRNLGTLCVPVTSDSPTAVPTAAVQANGNTYNIVGTPADYAYQFRSGKVASVNVYYMPEGYRPPGPYQVTVNYVDYLTGKVMESHEYTSQPVTTSPLIIDTPAQFTANDVDYIRLDGQEEAIEHSYYSNISSYTVYYRNEYAVLPSSAVIQTVRIVYRDSGTTVTDEGVTVIDRTAANAGQTNAGNSGGVNFDAGNAGTVNSGPDNTGTASSNADNTGTASSNAANPGAANANAGAANSNAAPDNTSDIRLDNSRTYSVIDDDDGNFKMRNESGVDSNAEHIGDDATPLTADSNSKGSNSADSKHAGMELWLLPVSIGILALIIIAAVIFVIWRRRNENGG